MTAEAEATSVGNVAFFFAKINFLDSTAGYFVSNNFRIVAQPSLANFKITRFEY
jgi:hypothetical protein